MEGFKTAVLSTGLKVDFTDDFIEELTLECLKYDVLQNPCEDKPMDTKRQTLLYAVGSAINLDVSAAEMQEITQLLRREIYYKARSYARECDGLCSAPKWLHEAAWRLRLLPAEHLPAPCEAANQSPVAPPAFHLSTRAARALLRRLHQTLTILHDPVLGVIWEDVRGAALQKLRALVAAGDRAAPGLSDYEWRVVDLVLLHDYELQHCVVSQESLKEEVQRAALVATCNAALSQRVHERASRTELARRWRRAYQHYVSTGLRASLVLVQRRWFEVTRLALAMGGADGAKDSLLHQVAQHVGGAHRPDAEDSWTRRVRTGMVFTEQDLFENELESVPSPQPTDCAPSISLIENISSIDENCIKNVKVEPGCKDQEATAAKEHLAIDKMDIHIKQEPDSDDIEPQIKRRKPAIIRFESDDSDDNYEQAPDAPNDVNVTMNSQKEGPISSDHEPHRDAIDPKLLMETRVNVERSNLKALLRMLSRKVKVEETREETGVEATGGESNSVLQKEEREEQGAPLPPLVPITAVDIMEDSTPPPDTEPVTDANAPTYNETPAPLVVKVTAYCPLGLKNTRLRFGEGQRSRELQAAKKHRIITQRASASRSHKLRRKRQEDIAPDPPKHEADLQEWIRQRNINSRYFGPAPVSLNPVVVADEPYTPADTDNINKWTCKFSPDETKSNNKGSDLSAFQNFQRIGPANERHECSGDKITYNDFSSSTPNTSTIASIFTTRSSPRLQAKLNFVSSFHTPAKPECTAKVNLGSQVPLASSRLVPVTEDSSSSPPKPTTKIFKARRLFKLEPSQNIVTTTSSNPNTSQPRFVYIRDWEGNNAKNATTTLLASAPTIIKRHRNPTAITTAFNHSPITAHLTPSHPRYLLNLVDMKVSRTIANPISTSVQTTASVPTLVEILKNTTATTTASNHIRISAQLSAPVPTNLQKYQGDDALVIAAANQETMKIQLPVSNPNITVESGNITGTTTAFKHNSISAQLPALIPTNLVSFGDMQVATTTTSQVSSLVKLPDLIPSLVAISKDTSVATTALKQNPVSAQLPEHNPRILSKTADVTVMPASANREFTSITSASVSALDIKSANLPVTTAFCDNPISLELKKPIPANQVSTTIQFPVTVPTIAITSNITTTATTASKNDFISVPVHISRVLRKLKHQKAVTTFVDTQVSASVQSPVTVSAPEIGVISQKSFGTTANLNQKPQKNENLAVSSSTTNPVITALEFPVSVPTIVVSSSITTVTTTSHNRNLNSSPLPVHISRILRKLDKKAVTTTIKDQVSPAVRLQTSAPKLVETSNNTSMSVNISNHNTIPRQIPAPISRLSIKTLKTIKSISPVTKMIAPTSELSGSVPMLVLTPKDNAVSVCATSAGHRPNSQQFPVMLPLISTNSGATIKELVSTSVGSFLQQPPDFENRDDAMEGSESSPKMERLLTSPSVMSWIMDQLTSSDVTMPSDQKSDTGTCTIVPENEHTTAEPKHDANDNKHNNTLRSEVKQMIECREPVISCISTSSTDGMDDPSLAMSQPNVQRCIHGNNVSVRAVDYVRSLSHRKLKVICKEEQASFWIVANDYLVLTDNPRLVVKAKWAFYTLAPPQEIARITFDLDGKENDPWDEPAGSVRDAACGGSALAPTRMVVEGKTYQKLCNSPLRYAQALGAVRDLAACRRLQARGLPLLLYHAPSHSLATLRSVRHLLRLINNNAGSDQNVIEIDVPEND